MPSIKKLMLLVALMATVHIMPMQLLQQATVKTLRELDYTQLKEFVATHKRRIALAGTIAAAAGAAYYFRSNIAYVWRDFQFKRREKQKQEAINKALGLEKGTPKGELREILTKQYESREARNLAIKVFIEHNPDFDLNTFLEYHAEGSLLPHQTPLHHAVTTHNESLIKLLVDSKADINVQSDPSQLNQYQYTPLMWAFMNGRWGNTPEYLLQQKADPNIGYSYSGKRPTCYATENALTAALNPWETHTASIKLLLAAGATLPERTAAFRDFAHNGNREVNKLLTDEGLKTFRASQEATELRKNLGISDQLYQQRLQSSGPDHGDRKSN